ncbi:aminodeoxychorismate synthase component I [Microbispora triticiradicis]|uniref:aminodeoxychorismate synthase n=2 Tax=Microbispora TaxID=2005 RepID=A0ABY3LP57_9ACTN|nr:MULTISPECIES: aminodeoxychorismate synthase component I [Microbispora]TLP50900.1 aminodeoxychorismate synthase component I [Microbispora fusca]TYB43746.1 aminodeoxychorismate synthase component I [Microbispora tritici]
MRTLLIDNYDSYSYNLFQLIAEVNGKEPTVLTNDPPPGTEPDLEEFDNIVISPGPGRPTRVRDFGISASVIANACIPVLGVCLGHQGIAAGEGVPIVSAPAARHGHLTLVTHNGEDLFRGLPQKFVAVRYHSLCVPEPLPPELEATAWAEDGVVMALAHRTRPLWGVQFHPESVATQFGRELLANFRALTGHHRFRRGRTGRPGLARRAEQAARTGVGQTKRGATPSAASRSAEGRTAPPVAYRLHVRELPYEVDAEKAFVMLFGGSDWAFWLDSAYVDDGIARFSFLGDASGPLAEIVSYQVNEGRTKIRRGRREFESLPGNVFDYLKRELSARRVIAPELPFDFTGGYVGYFGYGLKADCGSPNRHDADTPDAAWLFADRMVAIDHEQGVTYLLALSDGAPADTLSWLDATADRCTTMGRAGGGGDRPPPARTSSLSLAEPWLARGRTRYLADIAACKQQLLAGESYEICLTGQARLPAASDGLDFYRRLRRVNPAPYAAYLRFGELEIACSSPERFLRVDRERTVESKPIKGTVPRGVTAAEDARLRDSLVESSKTRAENLMIVDLLRNDLGRVCEVGSVHVPKLMVTETYATVHQLVSTIRGRLRGDADIVDCVRACFPGGSMTGAPKLRTLEIIDSLETEARGVYSGAIGFLGLNGTADLNIVIRTAVRVNSEWRIGAGGAIVLDSDPVEEYEEMLLKAAATLRALPADESPADDEAHSA